MVLSLCELYVRHTVYTYITLYYTILRYTTLLQERAQAKQTELSQLQQEHEKLLEQLDIVRYHLQKIEGVGVGVGIRSEEEGVMVGMGGRQVGGVGAISSGLRGSSDSGSGDRQQQQRSLHNRQAEVLVMESNCGMCM